MGRRRAEETQAAFTAEQSDIQESNVATLDLGALYWMGALPALGIVKHEEFDKDTGFKTIADRTALEAWNNENTQVWIGKCPYQQDFSFQGVAFPAFSSRRVRQGDTPDLAFVPYQGTVMSLTRDRLEKIKKAA